MTVQKNRNSPTISFGEINLVIALQLRQPELHLFFPPDILPTFTADDFFGRQIWPLKIDMRLLIKSDVILIPYFF